MKLLQMYTLVTNLQIVNSGSLSCPHASILVTPWRKSLVNIRGKMCFCELPPNFLFILTGWSSTTFFLSCIQWANETVCRQRMPHWRHPHGWPREVLMRTPTPGHSPMACWACRCATATVTKSPSVTSRARSSSKLAAPKTKQRAVH
jgi:hypothetical protein